ncbi:hypothetical protein HK101_005704 [Irineochytrium annulatum]|nr:hypothetical protein HK101_005704 [Irineochytrium annulatum]
MRFRNVHMDIVRGFLSWRIKSLQIAAISAFDIDEVLEIPTLETLHLGDEQCGGFMNDDIIRSLQKSKTLRDIRWTAEKFEHNLQSLPSTLTWISGPAHEVRNERLHFDELMETVRPSLRYLSIHLGALSENIMQSAVNLTKLSLGLTGLANKAVDIGALSVLKSLTELSIRVQGYYTSSILFVNAATVSSLPLLRKLTVMGTGAGSAVVDFSQQFTALKITNGTLIVDKTDMVWNGMQALEELWLRDVNIATKAREPYDLQFEAILENQAASPSLCLLDWINGRVKKKLHDWRHGFRNRKIITEV